MWMDKRTEFCDGTSAILAIGSAIIGNVYDQFAANMGTDGSHAGNVLLDLGTETPIYLVIQVDATFVGATSTTQFTLLSDSTSNLATSPTTHVQTAAIPVASLVAGFELVLPIPPDFAVERFVGIRQTVAVANVTAGAVSIFFTRNPRRYKAYADAIN